MKTNFSHRALIMRYVTLFFTMFCIFDNSIAQNNTFPSNGSVGIGTINPEKSLHILSSFSNAFYLDSGGEDTGSIYTDYDGGSAILNFQEKDDPFILRFIQTTGPYENTINFSHGFFGIGAKYPKDILHITGTTPSIRLSSKNYYGTSGGALGTVLSSLKFVNGDSDSNPNYRAEVRGILTGNWSTDVGISFTTQSDEVQKERLRITHDGKVGIGTTNPDSKLSVKGNIHAQEVKVDMNGAVAPDYVFDINYKLLTLQEVQDFINKNGHLPNVPSAKKMDKEGFHLKEMNLKLLEKVEELTLYILKQEQRIKILEDQISK